MRLDLDFIRNLLIKIDSFDTYNPITNYDLTDDDTPINKINTYLSLLVEEELISAEYETYVNGSQSYRIKYVTFKGQIFINKIKNNCLWEKYKGKITSSEISSLSGIIEFILKTQY